MQRRQREEPKSEKADEHELFGSDAPFTDDLAAVERLAAAFARDEEFTQHDAPRSFASDGATPLTATSLPQTVIDEAPSGGLVAWSFLGTGLTALVCGIALLAWSLAADRADLLTKAYPLALGGAIAVILGLLSVLDDMLRWRRETAKTIAMHDSFRELQASPAVSGVRSSVKHAAPSPAILREQIRSQHRFLAESAQLDRVA